MSYRFNLEHSNNLHEHTYAFKSFLCLSKKCKGFQVWFLVRSKKNTLLLNEVISVPARINDPPTVTCKNFQFKVKNTKLTNINLFV